MKTNRIPSILSRCGLAVALLGLPLSERASGFSLYTSGHADIGVGYDDLLKEFEPHWHLHPGAVVDGSPLGADTEFEPGDLRAGVAATRPSPSGLSSALGVPDGSTIYAAGSSAYQPNLGVGAEELDDLDWAGEIALTLTGWTVPGGAAFALYTTNLSGTSAVDKLFSTFAPGATDAANSFTIYPGDHLHFQWGFTAPGLYTFDLTWTGTHVGDGPVSTTESFSFQIIPEPSVAALLCLSLPALALCRRR